MVPRSPSNMINLRTTWELCITKVTKEALSDRYVPSIEAL
jgi:hypothetical protein